jgi:hypothetical protein
MYVSGYISLLPPPSFILPRGTNILFKLTSELSFVDFEVRLEITDHLPTTSLCTFKATVSQSVEFTFASRPCKDIKGGNNWVFVGFGVDFDDGVARGGIIYEIGGNIIKDQTHVESGINIMKQTIGAKDWHELDNEISFGGVVPGSSTPDVVDSGVPFKLKSW